MLNNRAIRLLQEQNRRKNSTVKTVVPYMLDYSYKQKGFIDDANKFIVARCTRRAGKTTACIEKMIKTCRETPKSPVLYLGLTLESAKAAVWTDAINLLQKFDIPHEAVESKALITFPNGSFIKLYGADAKDAKKRLRGRKWRLVIVDECGFYREVEEIIYVILPSLGDFVDGQLCLISSPGTTTEGLFYEADVGNMKDKWSQHNWSMADNPAFGTDRYEELKKEALGVQYGNNPEHPAFKREWLGLWVYDESKYVYKYDRERNTLDKLPANLHKMYAIISCDFGFVDANAIVVAAYSKSSKDYFIVDTFKQNEMLAEQIAAKIIGLQEKWEEKGLKITDIVGDGGGYGKSVIEEMRRRFGIPIRSANKVDKAFKIEILNNDLIGGYVKVLAGIEDLPEEWSKLDRLADGTENPSKDNHLSDANLYGFFESRNYAYTPKPDKLSEEAMILQAIEEQITKNKPRSYWDE